ncbi:hypothetical protein KI688_007706 [Linnemannia hyalina]|uniref:Uncharacterized protein n=1 Tax=Linnemannia hyalina TaxID=64524 RepID=A0A9P8BPN3_9FUNG|nr:hypothetical protein KI688_007706 [Linnemannia hyalina]
MSGDEQQRDERRETLRSIVEDEKDIGEFTGHSVVAMVAPSGSGRQPRTLSSTAICCSPGTTVSSDFKHPNSITLAKDVGRIYETIIDKEQGRQREPQDIGYDVKTYVGERVKLEFLARLLFLQLLLDDIPDLEPRQFFREQTTGGDSTIRELIYKLRGYDYLTIQAMLEDVQTKLHSLLVPNELD